MKEQEGGVEKGVPLSVQPYAAWATVPLLSTLALPPASAPLNKAAKARKSRQQWR